MFWEIFLGLHNFKDVDDPDDANEGTVNLMVPREGSKVLLIEGEKQEEQNCLHKFI